MLACVAVQGFKEGTLVRCKGLGMALAVVVSESNFGGPTVEILEGWMRGDSMTILEKNLMECGKGVCTMRIALPDIIYVAETYRRSHLNPNRLIWNDIEAETPEGLERILKTTGPAWTVRRRYTRRKKKGGAQ